ncbi:MAG TPA: NUDIX domain-containing protein [Patescibacteria group bacterium]|nr:NUDIX domain-containing protein [Patescibacteria group bacterium]
MNKINQPIFIGGAILFRDNRGKRQFLLVKQKEEGDWEIPKVAVRRGESSVRAVIRMISEQGGMAARILEEAGRLNANTVVNGKSVPQRFYYYLMVQKAGGSELIGFNEFKWLEYGEAVKRLASKKEKDAMKDGRDVLKEWEKKHDKKQLHS